MKFPPGSKFTGSNSFVFEYIFLQATHVFICFACQWTYQAIALLNKGHTAFSPSLKQNLMYEPYSFKSVIL